MMRGAEQVRISQAELTVLVKTYRDHSQRAQLEDLLDSVFMGLRHKLTNIESAQFQEIIEL